MATRLERRQALRQAAAVTIVLAAAVAAAIAVQHRPDGPDELEIEHTALRSFAAELELLDESTRREDAPPRFAAAHATQLTKNLRAERKRIEKLRPEPPLAPQRSQLQREADALLAQAQGIERRAGR
jgi:hypothetical protein